MLNESTDVDFSLVKEWDNGFEGEISITNESSSNIDGWSLAFDFPNEITNIWDAKITSSSGDSYVVGSESWNREITAGDTLTFNFIGSEPLTSEPQNFDLNGATFDSPSSQGDIYTSSNSNLDPELALNENYQGRATFYDAANPSGGKGNSGYDVPTSASELSGVTAINNVQWNGSEASGAFLEVSGPKQRDGAAPIVVQVSDLLYERADGLDLSAEAFAKVADPVDGVVNIDYELIGPPDSFVTPYGHSIGQGIVVEGIPESNPNYAAVRLNNHRYPIESIDLIAEDGQTEALSRQSDNRFVLDGSYTLNGAQDLVVTDIFGQQVTLDDVNITNGSSADVITGEQFGMI
jgi:expansin